MQTKLTLDKLQKGESAIIDSFSSEDLPAKYFELGITPGAYIQINQKAPFQGPICLQIIENNTLIAIRTAEASLILVNKI